MINNIDELKKVRIFRDFTDAELELLEGHIDIRTRVANKDATIIEAEEMMKEFMILIDGRLEGSKYHYDGDVDLVQLFSRGEIIGLDVVCSSTKKSPLTLNALEDSTLLCIDYDSLFSQRLPEELRKRLSESIIRVLANESLKRLHKIDVLYRKSLRSRIMVFLRHMATMNKSNDFHIFMDREQFAQYLGVNRSSLSHELSKMRDEGIIDFHKGHFVIKNDPHE